MLKRFLFILALSLAFACQNSNPQDELSRWEAQADRVEIIRDDFGVPHIYGKSDADAVFGLLYAQCEDDFRRVERNYIWAIGRLAELEGEKELYSDLRAQLYMTEAEAKAAYEKAPEWLKELCVAFADGINYYLHTHPEVTPQVITRYEPWMPMFFFEGSIGGDIERISTSALQAFYEQDSTLAVLDSQAMEEQILGEPQRPHRITGQDKHPAEAVVQRRPVDDRLPGIQAVGLPVRPRRAVRLPDATSPSVR